MPRERLDIRLFNKGMIPNADSADIDHQAASWCYNVDLGTREGQLIGLPSDEDKSSAIGAIGDAQGSEWIEKTDGKRTLVYFDNTDGYLKYISDFHGTPGSITSLGAYSGFYANFVRRHQSLRFGGFNSLGTPNTAPRWVGYTSNSIFGSSSSALITQNQECKVMSGLTSNGYFKITNCVLGSSDAEGFFTSAKRYYYRFALEYDGYQISVLDQDAYTVDVNYVDTGIATVGSIAVTLRAYAADLAPGDFNKRITGFLLFRAEGAPSAGGPSTSYRFVTRVTVDGTGWSTDGDDKTIDVTDSGTEGDTFETYSGLAETATNSILGYAVSCAADNYMFIGNCDSSLIEDAEYMIFRSVAGRYDVYDFQSANPSFVKLGIRPSAMCFFFGRLLVFDGSHMIRINPDTLSIEDVIDGYGCLHQQSLCVTRVGVFFADKNGINLYDGKTVERISRAIYEFTDTLQYNTGSGVTSITDTSYKTVSAYLSSTNPLKIAYHSLYDMLIIGVSNNGTTVLYGYSLRSNSWTVIGPPYTGAGAKFSFIVDKDSAMYIAIRNSTTNYFFKMMSDFATRRTWIWITQRLNFVGGTDDINQKFYKIHSLNSASLSRYYGIDEGIMQYSADPDGDINASYRLAKSLRVFLASAGTNKYINSISVIYRRMIGER